ncbi:MAG: hypothetical protein WBR18_09855 [Anaerolineales bacterium]
MSHYERYHIPTQPAPHLRNHPSRFRVKVSRPKLASLLVREVIHYRGDMDVVLSRPCVYGVFSGPVGGFAPRDSLCVGCLRCTVQYPDMVTIEPNPARLSLGDSYISPDQVDTILYEASTGRVPVKGAGYRGAYGGDGWDGMWTDMSEIVRPTRDGIHGREYISTAIDLGAPPARLSFAADGGPQSRLDRLISLPVPFLLDAPPAAASEPSYLRALVLAAEAIESLVVLPWKTIADHGIHSESVVPIVSPSDLASLRASMRTFKVVELVEADPQALASIRAAQPGVVIGLRSGYPVNGPSLVRAGWDFLHLTADYHGHTPDGFVLDAIQSVHQELVDAGVRSHFTLVGSGGIAAAEHVPKAIIAGLDVVGLDTPLLLAVQAVFDGEVIDPEHAALVMPALDQQWAAQRMINLAGSWRDQLLEIMGAMGLREVRRLRGEIGRAMFQTELERDAFAGIEGYPNG